VADIFLCEDIDIGGGFGNRLFVKRRDADGFFFEEV
jgi:hypothetical protein